MAWERAFWVSMSSKDSFGRFYFSMPKVLEKCEYIGIFEQSWEFDDMTFLALANMFV